MVLIIDGDQRCCLSVTRSLGTHGVTVAVGEEKVSSLSSVSRYCRRHVMYPSPYHNPERFYRFLLRFVRETKVDMVIPMTDVTTYLLSLHKKEFEIWSCGTGPGLHGF